jgi:hypothetical protein
MKDVRAKSGPRGGRYQNTRNVHLRIGENVPPRDAYGRPGSCISVTHDLPFRIEIRRLNGRALLFVRRDSSFFDSSCHVVHQHRSNNCFVHYVVLGESEFDAVIFECHSHQDGIYETPEDAAGRSEHDRREGLRTVPADGIDCSRPCVTQRER